jgi:hypothetical protein
MRSAHNGVLTLHFSKNGDIEEAVPTLTQPLVCKSNMLMGYTYCPLRANVATGNKITFSVCSHGSYPTKGRR